MPNYRRQFNSLKRHSLGKSTSFYLIARDSFAFYSL